MLIISHTSYLYLFLLLSITMYTALKKACQLHGWIFEISEELLACITAKSKGDMRLYNYRDDLHAERNHLLLVKCRGLVVRENGQILNYPFDRFFNEWEKERAEIDWSTAEIQEKIDGSLICVFWYDDNWEITTRGSFYPNKDAETDFAELFKKHFSDFDKLDKTYCYMFELVTKQNIIVTHYENEAVYLIGARNLKTLKEISGKALDDMAVLLGVLRPRRFSAKNTEECRKLFELFREDEEGLVLMDAGFNRVKIKQDSYIKLSRIKMLNKQDLFNHILGSEAIDAEYLARLPEVQKEISLMKIKWDNVLFKAASTFQHIKNKSKGTDASQRREASKHAGINQQRKEFAMEALKYPYSSLLFAMLDGKDFRTLNLRWDTIEILSDAK